MRRARLEHESTTETDRTTFWILGQVNEDGLTYDRKGVSVRLDDQLAANSTVFLSSQYNDSADTLRRHRVLFGPNPTTIPAQAFTRYDAAGNQLMQPGRDGAEDRLMGVLNRRLQEGVAPFAASKARLKAALCSPAFLHPDEPASEVSDEGGMMAAHALLSARLDQCVGRRLAALDEAGVAGTPQGPVPITRHFNTRRMVRQYVVKAYLERPLPWWSGIRIGTNLIPSCVQNEFNSNARSLRSRAGLRRSERNWAQLERERDKPTDGAAKQVCRTARCHPRAL